MEPKEKRPEESQIVDLSLALDSLKWIQIRKILELPEQQDFSIIRWFSPAEVRPEEATYVLAKLYTRDAGLISVEAAYEQGRFWTTPSLQNEPTEIKHVLAWSYQLFDDRVDALGRMKS